MSYLQTGKSAIFQFIYSPRSVNSYHIANSNVSAIGKIAVCRIYC